MKWNQGGQPPLFIPSKGADNLTACKATLLFNLVFTLLLVNRLRAIQLLEIYLKGFPENIAVQ
jgi:hypothetical protein